VDCAHCAAACCVAYVVGVGPDEIKRIQGAGYRDFTAPAFEVPDGVSAAVASVHLANMRFTSVIKKTQGGACVFLRWASNGSGSCTIYDVRPNACATFGDLSADLSGRCGRVRQPATSRGLVALAGRKSKPAILAPSKSGAPVPPQGGEDGTGTPGDRLER